MGRNLQYFYEDGAARKALTKLHLPERKIERFLSTYGLQLKKARELEVQASYVLEIVSKKIVGGIIYRRIRFSTEIFGNPSIEDKVKIEHAHQNLDDPTINELIRLRS